MTELRSMTTEKATKHNGFACIARAAITNRVGGNSTVLLYNVETMAELIATNSRVAQDVVECSELTVDKLSVY